MEDNQGQTRSFQFGVGDRTVYVRKSSSYYEHLSVLNAELASQGRAPVKIIEANELLRTADILEMVNGGLVDATVVDSYKAGYWSAVFPDMVVRDDLVVHAGGRIAWAFRKDSPDLAAAVNDFVQGHRQGTLVGNVLIDRYMGNLQWVRNSTSESGLDILQPLLDDFRKSGEENDLDPLMLAAQAYQESELDHSRKSHAGAVGIMQIKPSTAADRNVGIADVSTVEDNIHAGAKYLRFLADRYFSDEGITELNRWLLSLAAYNAGPARVASMRREAAADGQLRGAIAVVQAPVLLDLVRVRGTFPLLVESLEEEVHDIVLADQAPLHDRRAVGQRGARRPAPAPNRGEFPFRPAV